MKTHSRSMPSSPTPQLRYSYIAFSSYVFASSHKLWNPSSLKANLLIYSSTLLPSPPFLFVTTKRLNSTKLCALVRPARIAYPTALCVNTSLMIMCLMSGSANDSRCCGTSHLPTNFLFSGADAVCFTKGRPQGAVFRNTVFINSLFGLIGLKNEKKNRGMGF